MIHFAGLRQTHYPLTARTAKVAEDNRTVQGLARLLTSALSDAGTLPDDALFSVTLPAEGLQPAATLISGESCYFWQRPAAGKLLIGLGAAVSTEAIGDERFERVGDYYARLTDRWIHRSLGAAAAPAAFIGFSFDPHEAPGAEWHGLGNTLLTVPALLYGQDHEQRYLTFTATAAAARDGDGCVRAWLEQLAKLRNSVVCPGSADDPVQLERMSEPDAWPVRIERALAAIRAGRVDKIVLARRVRYRASRNLDCARILDALRAGYEDCALFAVTRPGCALVGVSPERLASCSGGTVVADALAGTAPRGRDGAEDQRLATALLDDAKVAEEHRLVVEQIRTALEPLCTGLMVPQAPDLLRLPRIQHVWTPLRGHLRPRVGLLELARALHPTPAVGGSPRREALAWLAQEPVEPRGWYTGAFGWLDRDGEGELSVVLRCGLVNERTVDLFAGAGIVSRSQPEEELAETEWKLLTMRGALQLG